MSERKLTNKQRVFIEEYLGCWNATEAARRAGYSERNINNNAAKILQNPTISEEVKRRIEEKTMSADEVLIRLAEQARGEHSRYIHEDGYVEIDKLVKDGKAHLIKAVKPGQYGTVYEFYDAQSALALIGKHHKIFTERVEHSGQIETPVTIIEIIRPDSGGA